jgi:hypothetical protein
MEVAIFKPLRLSPKQGLNDIFGNLAASYRKRDVPWTDNVVEGAQGISCEVKGDRSVFRVVHGHANRLAKGWKSIAIELSRRRFASPLSD